MNDFFEALQGLFLLEEGFLVVLKLIEEVRGENVLKKTEDVISNEHVEGIKGKKVLVDGLFFFMEDGPEEGVAVDDCVESLVGETALGEVAEPFGEQTDQVCDFERLEGDLDREVFFHQVGAERVTKWSFDLEILNEGVSQELQVLRKGQVCSVGIALHKFLQPLPFLDDFLYPLEVLAHLIIMKQLR